MAERPGGLTTAGVIGLIDHYAEVSGAARVVAYLHPSSLTGDVMLALAARRVRWIESPLLAPGQITVGEDQGPEVDRALGLPE